MAASFGLFLLLSQHIGNIQIFVLSSWIFKVFSKKIQNMNKVGETAMSWEIFFLNFYYFSLNSMVLDIRPTRGWNIFGSRKSWYMTKSTAEDTQSSIWFHFLVNKSLSSKQQKLNFWNWLYQKLAFLCRLLKKQPPENQTKQFWHQVSMQLWKLWSKFY